MTHHTFPGFKWYVKTSYQHTKPYSFQTWWFFLLDLIPCYFRFKAMYN